MTVAELIAKLERFPQHKRVLMSKDPEGNKIWDVDLMTLEDPEEIDWEYEDNPGSVVVIWPG